jgi:DNA-binding transcriptional regulator YhcF (GntR family)
MATSKSKPPREVMPSVSAAAVMSFLKDTRGLLTWTTRDLAETLGIPASEAAKVITIMEMQGYVKAAEGSREWFTTPAGQTVSGSKLPHYTRERVTAALAELKKCIAAARKDFKSPFKISTAVAFGDFLSDCPRVQAPDVGIELVKRNSDAGARTSATEAKARLAFLKQLRGKNTPLNVQPYQEWMGKRSHQKLLRP